MKIFGIEFAPLMIPLARRIQTVCVYQYTLTFLFGGFGCMGFCFLLLFTRFYYIPILYYFWFLYDRSTCFKGGRRSEWIRNWSMWRRFAEYFPLKLIKTVELDPNKNYFFACHPHGVLCYSHFCNYATEGTGFSKIFPGMRPYLLTLAGQFKFPFFREYFLTSGSCAASKESIRHLLQKEGNGNVLALIVGGAIEALNAAPGNYTLVLKHRKGFIKLALENGTDICPVYSFGENDLYVQVPNPEGSYIRKLQQWLTHKVGFSPPLFHGRGVFNYTFGLMPYRKPVHSVVGKPIEVKKNENPSSEDVEELHKKYTEALSDLFETHKEKYGIAADIHLEYV